MTGNRPFLVYPPTGARVAGYTTPAPHPPPLPATPPTAPAIAGDTAIAPTVTYADPDRLPVSATGARIRRTLRPRLFGAILTLLTAALALLLVAVHHRGHSAESAPRGAGRHAPPGTPAKLGPFPAHHGGLGPITLPNPEGNAARTIPLDTIWIIDKTLPAADRIVVSQEAPVDVAYLADHSLPNDQLGFTLRPRALENIRTHQASLTATTAKPATILVAEPSQPLHLPPVTAGHDRAIVIITTHPAQWLRDVQAGPTPSAPTARSRPDQTRTYILDLLPGSGRQADPLTSSGIQPQQLTADPAIRGGTARALARAFVDAIGAIWPA